MGRFHRHDGSHEHGHLQEHEAGQSHEHGHLQEHEAGHSHEHDALVHPPSAADSDLGDHSGYETGTERIDVLERIFDENDRTAAANRADFDAHGVLAINMMSSPGAGKTALLVETLRSLGQELRIGVIEGDIETSLDADRLDGLGAVVELVNTGKRFRRRVPPGRTDGSFRPHAAAR